MAKTKSKRDDTHQCEKCLPAYCCNYFAFGIDEPEDRRDYESLLWKIAHENVSFYIYRKDWYIIDRKSTRLNSSHALISYAVFCLKKKKKTPKH